MKDNKDYDPEVAEKINGVPTAKNQKGIRVDPKTGKVIEEDNKDESSSMED